MKKISDALTPILVLVLLSVIVYDKFIGEKSPSGVSSDATVIKLGKDYKAAVTANIGNPFNTVATGKYSSISELTIDQHVALDKALGDAYSPIATELEKRFGKAEDGSNKSSISAIQAFYSDLSRGYVKGK